MLKFMGANTNLFPLHAKKLLEVTIFCLILIYILIMILFDSHPCIVSRFFLIFSLSLIYFRMRRLVLPM